MKTLSKITKISIVAIICFFITITGCKNNDVEGASQEVAIKIAKDENFQRLTQSIDLIKPVLIRNFMKAKTDTEMKIFATKTYNLLLGNVTNEEFQEIVTNGLLDEKQIIHFRSVIEDIKRTKELLEVEYKHKIDPETLKMAFDIKVPQSTKTDADCSFCFAGNCDYCTDGSVYISSGGHGGGGSTAIDNGGGSEGGTPCRNRAGWTLCNQRVGQSYGIALGTIIASMVFTAGVTTPAVIIALAAAQVTAQVGLYNCKIDNC